MPVKVTSRAALIDEAPFGRLLAIIDDYDGWPTLTKALQFTALTFQRPGEVRLTGRVEGNRRRRVADTGNANQDAPSARRSIVQAGAGGPR